MRHLTSRPLCAWYSPRCVRSCSLVNAECVVVDRDRDRSVGEQRPPSATRSRASNASRPSDSEGTSSPSSPTRSRNVYCATDLHAPVAQRGDRQLVRAGLRRGAVQERQQLQGAPQAMAGVCAVTVPDALALSSLSRVSPACRAARSFTKASRRSIEALAPRSRCESSSTACRCGDEMPTRRSSSSA